MQNQSQHDFFSRAESVIANRPRETRLLGLVLQPMFVLIPNAVKTIKIMLAAKDPLVIQRVQILERLVDVLYFDTLCDEYHMFIEPIDLKTEHPAKSAELLLMMVSYLLSMIEEIRAETNTAITTRLKKADMNDDVRRQNLCVANKSIAEYSVSEILNALTLLGIRWNKIKPTPGILSYVLGLVHRGCLIMVAPMSAEVNDVLEMRREVTVKDKKDQVHVYYYGNYDFIRRLAGAATLTAKVLRFVFLTERPSAAEWAVLGTSEEISQKTESVYVSITDAMRKMENADTLGREMKMLFDVAVVVPMDLDIFVEKCNTDPARPSDVLFNARPATVHPAWSTFNQTVVYSQISQLRETSTPYYHQIYTYAQHLFSQELKMYLAETYLQAGGCNLMSDYFLTEPFFRSRVHLVMDSDYPTLIRLFGRTHVVYMKKLYECTSLEHALCVWALIIRKCKDGFINNVNVDCSDSPCLSGLFNEDIIASHDTAWGGVILSDEDF